jgi:hypothetical protein
MEVHFVIGILPSNHVVARDTHFQLMNWRRKVDLIMFSLGEVVCVLEVDFITRNNVIIEGHNIVFRIPSK